MIEEVALTIREAIPEDAIELKKLMKQVGKETEFLILDEMGAKLSTKQLRLELADLQDSENNVLLIAQNKDGIIGMASIRASTQWRIRHIGEIGISIAKDYWGIGLGSILLEELITWAENNEIIKRLELTVQARNKRAISLYKKFEFKEEALMHRGAQTNAGEWLDVYLMSRLIN